MMFARLRGLNRSIHWAIFVFAFASGCRPANEPLPPSQENRRAQQSKAEAEVDHRKLAEQAIRRQDWPIAESHLQRLLLLEPDNVAVIERLGDLAAQQQRSSDAIQYYQNVLARQEKASPGVVGKLSQQLMVIGQPFEVIALQQAFIERHPGSVQERNSLAGLASMLGLRQLAVNQLRWLVQNGHDHPEALVVLSYPEFVRPDQPLCEEVLRRCPTDQRAQYGLALADAMELQWDKVARRLQPVVQQHPEFIPAYSLMGLALIEQNQLDALTRWSQTLPAGVETSPMYWQVAGMWADRQGNAMLAAQAYRNALERGYENHFETLTGFTSALRRLDRTEDADLVSTRLDQLTRLHDTTKTLFEREGQSQRIAMQVADILLELGRVWEAEGWARHALSLTQERLTDARQKYDLIKLRRDASASWQLPDSRLADRISLPTLDSMAWSSHRTKDPDQIDDESPAPRYHFVDRAQTLGLNHLTTPRPESAEGQWIYQTVGGGAACLDVELDGWPDLVLAVQDGQPMKQDSTTDQSFRNLDGRFVNTTALTGLGANGFTQGICVADYDSDGFPDVLISTIGRNQLYRNNGDGTFQNVTEPSGLKGEFWTSQSLMVDVNDDQIADVFEVHYCGGTRFFEQPCRNRTTGELSNCSPLDYEAYPDRVWMGQGDGSFVEKTAAWMSQPNPGRGLGIVAGQLDGLPGMDLYVANDMTANHFWSPGSTDSGFRLVDSASVRGVAVSGQSLSQASMGVASADANQDGQLDLFVTHFFDEHNTFYESSQGGIWVDRSFQVGLASASMKLLGFGTQFIDFDNNGRLELIVANGHISDLKRKDVPFEMPAQVFHRSPVGNWREMPRNQLGEYFERNHLGRTVIALDADRNGMTDVLMTHLYEPVSLLMNETRPPDVEGDQPYRSIGIVLKATSSHRDAVGTGVSATIDGQTIYRQLTAGDGYMGSNEQQIRIGGLRETTPVSEVSIHWPSGRTERIVGIENGSDYLVVEGIAEPFLLPQN